jgi:NAD(P)-dependent dehydrogenase (short-subunit alcohol dehydrogenase family)
MEVNGIEEKTSPFDLSGTVSLVTGASGGIGRATCKSLAQAGSFVVAADLASDARIAGAAEYYPFDVTDEESWGELIALISSRHNRLDNLVNNAGVSIVNTIAETSLAEWRKCQAVNVEGLFLGTKKAADLLAKSGHDRKGGSSIVNLSSVAGLRGGAAMAAYSTSKGGARLFTKSAAMEYAHLNLPIRVNSIHPGSIDTGMMDDIYRRFVETGLFLDEKTAREAVSGWHPMGRMGKAGEIAEGIVYLCSSAASFVTGSELVIDGGMTAG